MAKVVKLDLEKVVIADENRNLLRIPYEELDFKPEVHDEGDIFEDNGKLLVAKSVPKSNQSEDKIHIKIVNENTQYQSTNMYVQAGKVVNKIAYIILFLLYFSDPSVFINFMQEKLVQDLSIYYFVGL